MAEGPAVKIDMENRHCVSLQEILEAFNAPLNEEQTWAICHQSSKFLQCEAKSKCSVCSELNHETLLLHKDGNCSLKESAHTVAGDKRKTEQQALCEVGLAVYSALDYGITGDKERQLSASLEHLLEKMIGDEEEENNNLEDEGIVDGQDFDENDWDEDNNVNDSKDGLRIERTIEDSQSSNGEISNYEDMKLTDDGKHTYATFTQVLQICASHLPHPSQAASHYQAVVRALVAEVQELTTFLEKITSGSKNLQRLATDKLEEDERDGGETEVDLRELGIQEWARLWMQVIKDLRKEVQLKKIEETRRAPIEFELTPYEMLLDDIRSKRYALKQVMVNGDIPPRVKKEAHDVILEFIRSRPPLKPVGERKMAPVSQPKKTQREMMLAEIKSEPRLKPAPRLQEKSKFCTNTTDSADYPSNPPVVKKKITIADLNILDWDELDSDSEPEKDETDNGQDDGHKEDDVCDDVGETNIRSTTERKYSIANFESMPNLSQQGPLVGSPRRNSIAICETPKASLDGWNDPVEYLSLTIDEVKHIRSVLCKAELENLQVNKKIYIEVLNEKVCFNCKKRFALFNRKYKCKLCKRIICSRCCRRMKIPSDHFLHIPVQALSPSASPTKCSLPNFHFDEEGLKSESAPATPSCSPTMGRRSTWGRSKSSAMKDICVECKTFMIQVLQTNRHTTPRR
ncbi:protein spire homolog 1-like isoform X2 [Ptychodera flava]|uniref:protein spire homolog 1-like isoform X2 n=1 Tax=Ptychodera flava TaxID=63121 RepID=UPI00396A7D9C